MRNLEWAEPGQGKDAALFQTNGSRFCSLECMGNFRGAMKGEQATILVANDDPGDLAKLTDRLLAEKFKVVPVSSREVVATVARSEVPSLILLDLDSCFDVCRMLKRNFVTEPIPVIALLFQAEEQDRIAVLELGADDCMAKPFSFRELVLRIRASLNRAQIRKGKTRYDQARHYYRLFGSKK